MISINTTLKPSDLQFKPKQFWNLSGQKILVWKRITLFRKNPRQDDEITSLCTMQSV